jgi:hypothetical protein
VITIYSVNMKKLYIEPTDRTPEIQFNYGKLRMCGTFVPVDPDGFYLPLHEWIKKYSNAPASTTMVDIGLKYTRGYAMSYVRKLLQELILIKSDKYNIIINWHFSKQSIDVKAGEFLSEKLNYPFNFIVVEEI